jgi:hypothetical protein
MDNLAPIVRERRGEGARCHLRHDLGCVGSVPQKPPRQIYYRTSYARHNLSNLYRIHAIGFIRHKWMDRRNPNMDNVLFFDYLAE